MTEIQDFPYPEAEEQIGKVGGADERQPARQVCLTPVEREAAWQKWFASGRPSEMLVEITAGKAWTMETIKEAFLAGLDAQAPAP